MRDAGCLMHPQPCAQKRQHVRAQVFTAEAPENPAIPHAMVLQLIPCSPRGGALLRPSFHRRWFVRPGWADEPPQDLTPASGAGPHGFVVRFRIVRPAQPSSAHRLNSMAACPANSDHARYRRVHRISSRVCDDRETPLVWDETKRVIGCFEQNRNRNIFYYGAGQPRNTNSSSAISKFGSYRML